MRTEKLQGVIIAIPSPLTANENIDIPSLRTLLDHCIDEGANGVMILGTMGEGTALLDSEKELLVEATVAHVNGRIPVLATASAASTRASVENAKAIDKYGVDYIVCTAPYYYKFPDPESVIQHVERITDAIEKPLIFYNASLYTGNPVRTDTLEQILNMDKVAGIKDSSCNYVNFVELLRRYPDRERRPGTIMQGDESVFDSSLLMGADGVVSGGGVAFISLLKQLYAAASSSNRCSAMAYQRDFFAQLVALLSADPQRNWLYRVKKWLVDNQVIADAHVTAPFLTTHDE